MKKVPLFESYINVSYSEDFEELEHMLYDFDSDSDFVDFIKAQVEAQLPGAKINSIYHNADVIDVTYVDATAQVEGVAASRDKKWEAKYKGHRVKLGYDAEDNLVSASVQMPAKR